MAVDAHLHGDGEAASASASCGWIGRGAGHVSASDAGLLPRKGTARGGYK